MARAILAAALIGAAALPAALAGRADAIDLRTATGPQLAAAAADGDLGVLRGDAGRRRAAGLLIASSEMSPTLGAGDLALVDRAAYRSAAPARGDVVVFRPTARQAQACMSGRERVARVVGVPGEVVRIDALGVTVDGAPLEVAGAGRPQVTRAFAPVPPGRVLVLGDNRRLACDSASWRSPFVAARAILGRVEGVFWPARRAGLLRPDGGLERLYPDPARRARLDAYVAIGKGADGVGGALLAASFCESFEGLCGPGEWRTLLAAEIRRQQGRLRRALGTLRGDCAARPVRRLLVRLERDRRATLRGRVGLARLERRLGYHHDVALSGMRTCWRVAISSQRVPGLR